MSLDFEKYVAMMRILDEMWEAGQGETEAADAIREQMEDPWYAMTSEEQEAVRQS